MRIKKTVLVAIINDVSTDQRVHKTCSYLTQKGFNVTVYGRILPDTFYTDRPYKIIHKKHWFNSKFFLYVEYNIRLLSFLLFKKFNYVLSNDLDTLPACFLASKIKKSVLVFDSHESFTETPEVQGRPFVQNFWRFIEKLLLPKLKKVYTVSSKIANSFTQKYHINAGVIKNVPLLNNKELIYEAVSFPTKNSVLLYQGKLTKNRGLTQAIDALKYLQNIDLVLIGHGKEEQNLQAYVKLKKLENRVHFLGRIQYEKLYNYTKLADIGLILEEPAGASFQYSLPNKLFDYIHAELPIIASPLFEIKEIIKTHQVGVLIENHNPKHIAEKIELLLSNEDLLENIKSNQKIAKKVFCWEKESKLLDNYFM